MGGEKINDRLLDNIAVNDNVNNKFWVSGQTYAVSQLRLFGSHDGVSQQAEAMNALISSAQLVHKFDKIKYYQSGNTR